MNKEKVKAFLEHAIISGIIVVVAGEAISLFYEENKPSVVFVNSRFDRKLAGDVDNETIPISHGGGDDSCISLVITNQNATPIDICDIVVEVIDYKDLDEFTVENLVGGADESVYYWLCDISNEKKDYHSTYIGTEKDSEEDKSGESHLVVEAKGLESIRVKLNPDYMRLREA